MFKYVRDLCGFLISYVNFLILLYNFFEEYLKLCYCVVLICIFIVNMKIICEICEEEFDVWCIV